MRGSTRGPWWVVTSSLHPSQVSGNPPHSPSRVLSLVGPRSTPPSTYHVAMSRSGWCTVQPAFYDTVNIRAEHDTELGPLPRGEKALSLGAGCTRHEASMT